MRERLIELIGLHGLAEWALLAVVLLLLARPPRALAQGLAGLEAKLQPVVKPCTERPALAVLFVGLLAIALRAAVMPWLGAPAPGIHDEHSLLLQAQTYMAGRLANPTHPFWPHFESFHINQVPAYASMYFPGRGLPLAVGLWLVQEPWLGVWLSVVVMCMAAVWMLQAWVSAPLALLGGVLLVLRFGVFSYWINSYWGGAFTALGALLVVGALPHVLKAEGARQRLTMGCVMGLGALILMTTRPYEGFLMCLPVALTLAWAGARGWWRRGKPHRAAAAVTDISNRSAQPSKPLLTALLPVALPVLLFTSAGVGLLLAYNLATTGQIDKTPYELNRQTYSSAPAFLISPSIASAQRGPAYFRDFYAAEAEPYARRSSLRGWLTNIAAKTFHNWSFYLGPLLTVPFVVGLWYLRRNAFVLGGMAIFATGYALETWNFPHYTAPLSPLLWIVLLSGFSGLRQTSERGLMLARALPVAMAALLLLPLSSVLTGYPAMDINAHSRACCVTTDTNLRKDLQQQLLALPGQDLVLVKDGPNNPLHFELVYNDADIDRAPIVWAHRLSPAEDAALRAYFAGHQQWAFEWRPDLPLGYTLDRLTPEAKPAAPYPTEIQPIPRIPPAPPILPLPPRKALLSADNRHASKHPAH